MLRAPPDALVFARQQIGQKVQPNYRQGDIFILTRASLVFWFSAVENRRRTRVHSLRPSGLRGSVLLRKCSRPASDKLLSGQRNSRILVKHGTSECRRLEHLHSQKIQPISKISPTSALITGTQGNGVSGKSKKYFYLTTLRYQELKLFLRTHCKMSRSE